MVGQGIHRMYQQRGQQAGEPADHKGEDHEEKRGRSPPDSVPAGFVGQFPGRAKRGIIFQNCNPQSFGRVLERRLRNWEKTSPLPDLFFLNGWNESAEGNHLEPNQRFGLGYLEELRRVRNPVAGEFGWPKILDNGH